MMRCAICGCSRLDARGLGCALCGAAPAVRWEQVHVNEETKAKLLAHAEELKKFGITLEQHELLQKDAGTKMTAIGLVLAVVDSLRSGVLHDLVLKLHDLAIPKEQIQRLRLDEPETISEILERGGSENAKLNPAPSKPVARQKPASKPKPAKRPKQNRRKP
jgi:hypothetical protein